MKNTINARQSRFCELVASGESQTDAWLMAGYKVSREVAAVNANESLRNPKIAARVAELRAQQTAAATLTRDRKRKILKLIAENLDLPPDVRIRAMAEDSKMAGHYEPDRHVVDAGPNTLARARERAAMFASPLNRLNKLAPTAADG